MAYFGYRRVASSKHLSHIVRSEKMGQAGVFSCRRFLPWVCSPVFVPFPRLNDACGSYPYTQLRVRLSSIAGDLLTVAASLMGVRALLFNAKGNVRRQMLTVAFGLLCGVVCLQGRYDGEMIPDWGMTTSIARASVYTWCKRPYACGQREVAVASLQKRQVVRMLLLALLVTAALYFVLASFHTANLFMSTISVTTSFAASYFAVLRGPYDNIVLILLWAMMCAQDAGYISMVVCLSLFLCNDLYRFSCWQRRKAHQHVRV